MNGYLLYKGATRPAMWGGVPTMPLLVTGIACALIAFYVGFFFGLGIFAALWALMAGITKKDDKAFRIIGLWLMTKAFNRGRGYWGAASFSIADYRRKR